MNFYEELREIDGRSYRTRLTAADASAKYFFRTNKN